MGMNSIDDDLFEVVSSTPTLGNQKNGWKGACIIMRGPVTQFSV
jgi:hypothetical protein